MVTVRQIARLAGVCPATVTRALRGDRYVRAEVRQRVREIAELYQYRGTQRPAESRTQLLGCVVPSLQFDFYARLVRGVLGEAFAEGYQVCVLEAHSQGVHTQTAIHTLAEQGVAGILVGSEQFTPLPREVVLALRGRNVTPVSIDLTPFEAEIDTVGNSEEEIAGLAVEYLASLGHQRIAFAGMLPAPLCGRPLAVSRALQRRGLPASYLIDVGTLDFAHADAARILDRIAAYPHPPTALIAWEDRLAARVMQTAHARGLRIPRDLSVMGISNHELASLTTPSLTSIEQHPEEIGRRAMALLLHRLNEEAPTAPASITVPCRLVVRDSCGRHG
jgi:LacI family transcriptional regulator